MMFRERIDKKIPLISYICIYFLLLFKAGFYFIEYGSSVTSLFYICFLLILVLLFKRTQVSKRALKYVLVSCGLVAVSMMIHGMPDLNIILLELINLLTAVLIICLFDEDTFMRAFSNTIFAISIASIVGYVVIEYASGLLQYLPTLVNSSRRVGWFAVLTTISNFRRAGAQRIQGIFWEPGAFQALIILAIVFETKLLATKKNYLKLVVYSVAILFTVSTTGYIALAMIWIFQVNNNSGRLKALKLISMVTLIAFFLIRFSSSMSGFLQYTLFRKVSMVFDYQEGVMNDATSRAGSLILPLKLFLQDPIFGFAGNGSKRIVEQIGLMTCTPVNYLTTYGILFAAVSYYGFYKFFFSKKDYFVNNIVLLCTLLIAFSTENFFMNPILTVLILYGFAKKPVNQIELIGD